jgi:hypothetical protein
VPVRGLPGDTVPHGANPNGVVARKMGIVISKKMSLSDAIQIRLAITSLRLREFLA